MVTPRAVGIIDSTALVVVSSAGEGAVDPKAPHGEHLVESLPHAARSVWPLLVQFSGEAQSTLAAGMPVRVRERSSEALIDA